MQQISDGRRETDLNTQSEIFHKNGSMAGKKCSTCKSVKEVADFFKCFTKWDGLQTSCKECQSKKSFLPKYKTMAKKSKLKTKYNLTIEEFELLHTNQFGRCAICKHKKPLQVDHNHSTSKIRGLLCRDCNVGIGFLKEDVIVLEEALEYIRKNT